MEFNINLELNRSNTTKIKNLFVTHFEWTAFSLGLLAMALLDPATKGSSWCLFEQVGITFCPGEGLGHSIAYLFRGQFDNAIQANAAGPLALFVLSGRIIFLIRKAFHSSITKRK